MYHPQSPTKTFSSSSTLPNYQNTLFSTTYHLPSDFPDASFIFVVWQIENDENKRKVNQVSQVEEEWVREAEKVEGNQLMVGTSLVHFTLYHVQFSYTSG